MIVVRPTVNRGTLVICFCIQEQIQKADIITSVADIQLAVSCKAERARWHGRFKVLLLYYKPPRAK